MGEAEWLKTDSVIRIHSDFYFYGEAASAILAESIAKDIADHWNAPAATVVLKNSLYSIEFVIRGFYEKDLVPETVWYNTNPRNNYFRIEEVSSVLMCCSSGIIYKIVQFEISGIALNAIHE